MYGIFTYIYHTNTPNVGKYTIHYMDPVQLLILQRWMFTKDFFSSNGRAVLVLSYHSGQTLRTVLFFLGMVRRGGVELPGLFAGGLG